MYVYTHEHHIHKHLMLKSIVDVWAVYVSQDWNKQRHKMVKIDFWYHKMSANHISKTWEYYVHIALYPIFCIMRE